MIDVEVGQRVVARDAFNRLRTGEVHPVPREWRSRRDGDASTTRGAFPKVWVRFAESGHVEPWPAEDVYTDIETANRAVVAEERA